MKKYKADEAEASVLQNIFKSYEGLNHLKVKIRRDLLVVESEDEEQVPYAHTRFRKVSSDKWVIEMPSKMKWQNTFMEGSLKKMAITVIEQFPWMLAGISY